MTSPVLITKLYIPPPRPKVVTRPRLIDQLNDGRHRSRTLISAPPGFGKTSLVSEWTTKSNRPTAWLSLDEGDSDPARFMMYLIAALQTAAPDVGAAITRAAQLSQPPSTESILTALLNDISELQSPIVLVLDDYHLIESKPVAEAVTFLIEHMPPQLHLVITTREDPPLPLARLRASGRMTELRASDLRFTPAEAAAFMSDVMGLNLSERDVSTLENRTEGWIAGLQLAALSIRGRDDLAGFIEAFAGDDRYIVDYLVEEVLQRQPQHMRQFLLQTSILDRLSGPLCDAVTGHEDSKKLLHTLEMNNLFMVPLDEKRHWYRFHHLFAEVLRAYLMDEQPDLVPVLHRRASAWFQQHEMLNEAVRHALAAKDFERAADLIAISMPALSRSRQEVTVLGWLLALPDDVIRARPILNVDYVGVLLQAGGNLDDIEVRLSDAEQGLQAASDPTGNSAGIITGDEDAFRRLPAQIAIYRAGLALIRGDVAATMSYAGHAIALLPEDDDFGRGAAAGLLGLASWTNGDLEAGYLLYTECMTRLLRANFVSDTFGCALVLADIRTTQGRLHEAMGTYERALQLAAMYETGSLRGVPDMHVGISRLHLERNDLEASLLYLQESKNLGEHSGLPQNPYRWCVAMARIREAQGDLHGALDLLEEAARLYVGDFSPNVRPIAALMARMWVAAGNIEEARGWSRQHGLTAGDELSYLHEYEHITLARVLIAQGGQNIGTAMTLMGRLLHAATEGGRTGSVIEILVLQACALEALGDLPQAIESLKRALTLAEPEGYVRVFIDERMPMARLLAEAKAHRIMPEYTSKLLAAYHSTEQESPQSATFITARQMETNLSQRELEVVGLISQGFSNKEISETLFLAIDTVKGHNRTIFRKLGSQNRTEAVARAREIGLL